MRSNVRIGVLDIQGSVEEHLAMLGGLGVSTLPVKTVGDLERVAGLILPGGESTTIGRILQWTGLDRAILFRAQQGMPIYGTCAGAILMAKKIVGKATVPTLGLMDIDIERNGYGRQLDSFQTAVRSTLFGEPIPALFIRAPRISRVGPQCTVLASHEGDPVLVQERNLLASMFHPELTLDSRIHEYFLSLCYADRQQKGHRSSRETRVVPTHGA